MRSVRLVGVVAFAAVASFVGGAAAGDKGKKVAFESGFTVYFVKNNAPVKDNPAFLVLTDKAGFDQVFGAGVTMKKPKTIDPKAFEKKIVVAVIRKSNALWTFGAPQVTDMNGTLRVEYEAIEGTAGTATFAWPYLLLVDGRDYSRVVFVEGGKEVATVNVKK